MTEVTVQDAIAHALRIQNAGDADSAEEIYRQVLETFPDQPDALHLLGALQYQRGELDAAIDNLRRAIASAPAEPSFRLTLGAVYQSARRFSDAVRVYEEVIASNPNIAAAHDHLGVALSIAGRDEAAASAFRRALALEPSAGTLGNLGIALARLRQFDEGIASLHNAIAQSPTNYSFRAGLANALYAAAKYDEAAECSRRAIELSPERGEAYSTFSAALIALDQCADAVEPARRAVERLPGIPDLRKTWGDALRAAGRIDEAVAVFQEALIRFPDAPNLHDGLGIILRDIGDIEQALAKFRRAMDFRMDPAFHSHFLSTLHLHATMDASTLFERHREFDRIHVQPHARRSPPLPNDPTPGRRLRIGYVVSDSRSYAIAHCVIPLLNNHDKTAFETFSYVRERAGDASPLKRLSDHWTRINPMTEDELDALIRADGIDILIDLHQHADGNCLPLYARTPAPVQISFGDYPATTGLSTLHYRLTDRHLEPPDSFPVPSSETPILLPDTLWCYSPPAIMPDAVALPALQKKHIALGNFGEFRNINEPALKLWSSVLKAIDDSTLTLAAPEGAHRARTKTVFEQQGIDPARISFVAPLTGWAALEPYNHIDIGLDTFPVNGNAASLNSFFMGVPVITLAGTGGITPLSRVGWSQLVNLRLKDLAAFSAEEFIRIAVALTSDLPRLAELRRTLRTRMSASPLMDAPRYTRNIEAAYRTAWERWCRKQNAKV